jgi:hypothetical protein
VAMEVVLMIMFVGAFKKTVERWAYANQTIVLGPSTQPIRREDLVGAAHGRGHRGHGDEDDDEFPRGGVGPM